MTISLGKQFRLALEKEKVTQIVGVINAYAAIMAKEVGFPILYLSGAGVANASYGLPDLGMTTLDNVLSDVDRILEVTHRPLLVDIDTGWGSHLMIKRTIEKMEKAGVAAVHIEDQPFEKRCGHRDNKSIVSTPEMVGRLKAACDARQDPSFIIMARTDAYAVEGFDKALERALLYEEAGADMHFIEAIPTLDVYKHFTKVLKRPILANLTEFGKTPLFSLQELESVQVKMALYPLSAWRAMNLAALNVYQEIKKGGTQKRCLQAMQTREDLYQFLQYEAFEKEVDNRQRKT